jgi:hypothetical protein
MPEVHSSFAPDSAFETGRNETTVRRRRHDSMGAWDVLRQQHAELLQLAHEVDSLFDQGPGRRDATWLRLKLSKWARKLQVHLTLEDRLVYPRLTRGPDPQRAKKASRHQEEMRAMRETLKRFEPARLLDELSDEARVTSLVVEARRIFGLLAAKFRFEDTELYGPSTLTASGRWAVHEEVMPAEREDDAPSDEPPSRIEK